MAYARASGQMPPELILAPIPPGLNGIWDIFLQLNHMRGSGMGPSAISAVDLLAYQQLNGIELNPWELDCIYALDQVALRAAADQKPTPDNPQPN